MLLGIFFNTLQYILYLNTWNAFEDTFLYIMLLHRAEFENQVFNYLSAGMSPLNT